MKALVVSPQEWGVMHVAKHHYAISLLNENHEVYFLEPPRFGKKWAYFLKKDLNYENLSIISYNCPIPFFLRFKVRWLYDLLIKKYISKLVKCSGDNFDLVWSFESNLYSDLNIFRAKNKIYHPVDELHYHYQIIPGKTADLIVSVTHEILSKFNKFPVNSIHVNHGLANCFALEATKKLTTQEFNNRVSGTLKVGYIGNLLRPAIDYELLLKIIKKNKHIRFLFWGNHTSANNNLGGEAGNIEQYINMLKFLPNVEMRGSLSPEKLASEFQVVDAFLICYDINKDLSRGTNYHKIMEYLSTGKVIISNNVTAFQNEPDLVVMSRSRENDNELFHLFDHVIKNIEQYNQADLQIKRIKFSLKNTYSSHLKLILESLIK